MKKIAATVAGCGQISMNDYRDWRVTKIFDYSATIGEIDAWAKTFGERYDFRDVLLSDVEEETTATKPAQRPAPTTEGKP